MNERTNERQEASFSAVKSVLSCVFSPHILSLSPSLPSSFLSVAKLFLAWEKKVFTLRPGLCWSHAAFPLAKTPPSQLHGLHIFPPYYKTLKKDTQSREPPPIVLSLGPLLVLRERERKERERRERERDRSCINNNIGGWMTNAREAHILFSQMLFYTTSNAIHHMVQSFYTARLPKQAFRWNPAASEA